MSAHGELASQGGNGPGRLLASVLSSEQLFLCSSVSSVIYLLCIFILFCFVQGVCRDLSCHDQACAAEALAEAGLEGALSDHGCWQPNAQVKSHKKGKNPRYLLYFLRKSVFPLEL